MIKLRNLIITLIFTILDLKQYLIGESEAIKTANCIGNFGYYNIVTI